jgi:class 3 adenylate cyclase
MKTRQSTGSRADIGSICSVLCAAISDYSGKPVFEQIASTESLKRLTSEALEKLAADDHVAVVREDSATICFRADPDDCLHAALNMRERLRKDEPYRELAVRIGVNLGRVVGAARGAPPTELGGDGIDLARSVMELGKPGDVIASRAYYEAMSQASPEHAALFHYRGRQTDRDFNLLETYRVGPGRAVDRSEWPRDSASALHGVSPPPAAELAVPCTPGVGRRASVARRLPFLASTLVACAAVLVPGNAVFSPPAKPSSVPTKEPRVTPAVPSPRHHLLAIAPKSPAAQIDAAGPRAEPKPEPITVPDASVVAASWANRGSSENETTQTAEESPTPPAPKPLLNPEVAQTMCGAEQCLTLREFRYIPPDARPDVSTDLRSARLPAPANRSRVSYYRSNPISTAVSTRPALRTWYADSGNPLHPMFNAGTGGRHRR